MKLDIKFDLKNFSPSVLKQSASFAVHFWQKIRTLLFFIVSLALIVLGVYIWQQSLFGKGWSEEKKQEYMNSQSKKIIFKEEDFRKTVSDVQSRKNNSSEAYQPAKDIFKPY